jgi:hypothetical protein
MLCSSICYEITVATRREAHTKNLKAQEWWGESEYSRLIYLAKVSVCCSPACSEANAIKKNMLPSSLQAELHPCRG